MLLLPKMSLLKLQSCPHRLKSILLRPSSLQHSQRPFLRILDLPFRQESLLQLPESPLHVLDSNCRLELFLHGLESSLHPLDSLCDHCVAQEHKGTPGMLLTRQGLL
jgi:hypothetical protein